tara:strand:- start:400 stop:669 length:270 start_codon:yes stop_codon:yes gene_type:complete
MSDKFWVVQFKDGAIMGFVSGEKSQKTVAGPFDTYDEAMEEKRDWRRVGCIYYGIRESEEKPKDTSENYRFADADREFDDCAGQGYNDY